MLFAGWRWLWRRNRGTKNYKTKIGRSSGTKRRPQRRPQRRPPRLKDFRS